MYRLHSNVSLLSPLTSLAEQDDEIKRFMQLNSHEIGLLTSNNFVTWKDELNLIDRLVRFTEDSEIGLKLGMSYKIYDYSVFGYALLSAATIGDALRFAFSHLGLSFTFFNYSLLYDDDTDSAVVDIKTKHDYGRLTPYLRDRDLFAAYCIINHISGGALKLSRLELSTPLESSKQTYSNYYQVPEVIESDNDRLYFDNALLDVPLPHSDTIVHEMCKEKCLHLLQRTDDTFAIEVRVREQIMLAENTDIKQDQVAAHLNISGRSLRELLQRRGTSFRAIIDSVRFSIAKKLIAEGNLSIDQIGMKVGYSSSPNFNHAFKRWSDGTSPTEYRKSQQKP